MARQPKAKPEREIRDIPDMSAENVRRLVHELRTHQIELEAQNEELRRAKDELIEVRDNYASLYDFGLSAVSCG